MKPLRVAIQGVRASFHDQAAQEYFGAIDTVECRSFKILCDSLQSGQADVAMMAIENSIAGSILTNYSLLETYGFKILGEHYLRIEMCLMALPGQKLSDLKTIQSHPMAILQCESFLATLGPQIQVIESADTAESAKKISEQKLKHNAAIASRKAALHYGLEIVNQSIETNKKNYTRFLAISTTDGFTAKKPFTDHSSAVLKYNKASIRFETAHEPGSLAKILTLLSESQINMTKIQSVPILGKPYQYGFHVDLEWENMSLYQKAIENLKQNTSSLIHFGEYLKGAMPAL